MQSRVNNLQEGMIRNGEGGRREKGAIDFPEESKALRCILFMKWSGGEGRGTLHTSSFQN